MTTHPIPKTRLLLATLLSLGISGVAADPPRPGAPPVTTSSSRPDGARADSPRRDDSRRDGARWDGPPPRIDPGYKLDSRHRHDRYYPPRGSQVDRLPHHPIVVPHHDSRYYFHGGVWYRPSGLRFLVVAPPIGLGVSVLPPYYTTLWIGGSPYYYADEVYYTWRPERREYVVVDPPSGADAYAPPPEPEQLFVYPRLGQDEPRMAKDRYECHRWAVDQAGFDPTQPPADMAAAQFETRRADYQRATRACLEARGYSVR